MKYKYVDQDMRVGSLVHFLNSLMDANIVDNTNIVLRLYSDLEVTLEKEIVKERELEMVLRDIRLCTDFSWRDIMSLDLFIDGYFGGSDPGDISIG